MRKQIALALVLTLFCGVAHATPPPPGTPGHRPVLPQTSPSNEGRYGGVEFPAGSIVEAVATAATEWLHASAAMDDRVPLCVQFDAILMVTVTQRTCFCWTQRNIDSITVAAPSADGGCAITNSDGPDHGNVGACIPIEAGQTRWLSPNYQTVRTKCGASDGLCTVATSTSAGLGVAMRYPCDDTWECTGTVGSGTCGSLAALTTAEADELRYTSSCAFTAIRTAADGFVGWSLAK